MGITEILSALSVLVSENSKPRVWKLITYILELSSQFLLFFFSQFNYKKYSWPILKVNIWISKSARVCPELIYPYPTECIWQTLWVDTKDSEITKLKSQRQRQI